MVNSLIDKEARDCLDKNAYKKKSFNLTTDELLPMWIYVIINADLPNILSEKCILQDFTLKISLNENDFILILFIQAIESFRKDNLTNNRYSNITPIIIQTSTIIPEPQSESYANTRSQSMVSNKSTATTNEGGLFNSIKGIFK